MLITLTKSTFNTLLITFDHSVNVLLILFPIFLLCIFFVLIIIFPPSLKVGKKKSKEPKKMKIKFFFFPI